MRTMFKNYFRPLACLGFFLSVLLTSQASWAQTWTGAAGDRNWNTPGNWNPAVVPNGAAVNVAFTSAGGTAQFITINTPIQLNSLTITNSPNAIIHVANGGKLSLAGDLTADATSNFVSASHPSARIEFNGTTGVSAQVITKLGGGTFVFPGVIFNNTSTNKSVQLAPAPNATNLTIAGYDGSFQTVLHYAAPDNSIDLRGNTLNIANGLGNAVGFITIQTGSGTVAGDGTFQIDGTVKIAPEGFTTAQTFTVVPNLVLRGNGLSTTPFDIGYSRLRLGGNLSNNVLAGGTQPLGAHAQLEFARLSGDQTYDGGLTNNRIEVASVHINKAADRVVFRGDLIFKFTTVNYNPDARALLSFASGSQTALEVTAGVALRFATSGFISAGQNAYGTETLAGSKITGAGDLLIDNYPTAGVTPAITVTAKSDLIVGTRVDIRNGHNFDLMGNTLNLSGNLIADGFITSRQGEGTLRFTSSTVQTVSTTLTTVAIPLPKVEMAKAAGSVTFGNNVALVGPSTDASNILSFITFRENGALRNNQANLNLANNRFLTISGAGALTLQATTVTVPASTNIGLINGNPSGGAHVSFQTASRLGSDFTINVPNTFVGNFDVNIANYKLTLGGNLGTSSNVTGANFAFITATDFSSAQVIFTGTGLAAGSTTVDAFITGLPNVRVTGKNLQLLGNLNFYGSFATAPSFVSTLQLEALVDLNGRFATISGTQPQLGVTATGGFTNVPTTNHGTLFVSSNAGFLTINTPAGVTNIDLGNRVDLLIGQGSGISLNNRDLTIRGDFFNSSNDISVFATFSTNSLEKIVFADNVQGKGNFSTVAGNVAFPRLAVAKTNTNTIATPNCFASVNPNAGLNIGNAFVTISANVGTVLDLRTNGVVVMNGGQINKVADGGDVAFGAAGLSYITGSGALFFTGHTTVIAGDVRSYGPAVGIATGKTLTLNTNTQLSIGGDLLGGELAGTGAVRFIGGNFQTVNIAALPGMIIDKCPTGPFLTVGQVDNITLGASGLTIESGVLAMNSAVFTSGNVLVKAGANNFITSGWSSTPLTFNTAQAVLVFNTVANLTIQKENGFISVPALAMRQGGNVTVEGNGVALFGRAEVGTNNFYSALDMQSAGNLVLNGKQLHFMGGGNAAAFQSGTGTITGLGDVFVSATNLYFTTTPVRGTPYSFSIDQANLTFTSNGRVALNGGTLRLGGNLVNNSQVNAFITTTQGDLTAVGNEAYGLLNMTGANAFVTGSAEGIRIPALRVENKLTIGIGAAGAGYVNLTQYYGTNDATGAFATVLDFAGAASSIELNNRFLTISGEGVVNARGASITGGTKEQGVYIAINSEGATNRQFITGILNIPTAGVAAQSGAAANGSYIMWDDRYIYDLRLGGNLSNGNTTAALGNNTIFRDVNGDTNIPNTNLIAGRNSVVRFTGTTFATVNHIETFPNFQVEKTGADVLVSASLANQSVFFMGGGNVATNNKLAITSTGNLRFTAPITQAHLHVSGTSPNGGTIAQTGTGIVIGNHDNAQRFLVSGNGTASFVTVASQNFVVTGFERFVVDPANGSRVHLIGAYDRTSTNGATLTLGVNRLENQSNVNDIFGGSTATFANGDAAADAAHLYPGYDRSLIFLSATGVNQEQFIAGGVHSHLPALRTQAVAGSFSTVQLRNGDNAFIINGLGLASNDRVLDLGANTHLRFDNSASDIKIFSTAGNVFAGTNAFISGTAQNTEANKFRQNLVFMGGNPTGVTPVIESNLFLDKTSVIIRNGAAITTNNLLQIGGSLSGNQTLVGAPNTQFTATATAGTGILGIGTVEFVTAKSDIVTQAISGLATLPKLSINTFATAFLTFSPSGVTTLTGTVDALTFKSGFFELGGVNTSLTDGNTLNINGNAAGIVNNVTSNRVINRPKGTISFTGTGNSFVSGTGFPESSVVTTNATHLPKVVVNKPVGTEVILGGSIFITASDPASTNLVVAQGRVDLNNQNILLAQGATMVEDVQNEHIIRDSRANNPALADYGRVGGNIYATAVVVPTGAAQQLAGTGILMGNGAGTFYTVDVTRRHGVGNGSLGLATAAVNRYFNVTPKTTPTVAADASTEIIYANSELNGFTLTDLGMLRFTTADPVGVYQAGGGVPSNNKVSLANPGPNFSAGYLTLGAAQINLFTTVVPGSVTTNPLDASEDALMPFASARNMGAFRLTYPRTSANLTVGLRVVNGMRSATFTSVVDAPADGSGNGDYFLSVSGSNTPVAIAADGNFNVTLPNGSFETFITVVPKFDTVMEGDEFVTVQLVSATGTGFTLGRFTTASLTIKDDDVPGFEVAFATVTKAGASVNAFGTTQAITGGVLATSEFMSAESFSVRLTNRPNANVTLNVVSNRPTEGLVSTNAGASFAAAGTLVFTPTNFNTAQFVTVRGVDDDIFDGTQNYFITVNVAAGSSAEYVNPAAALPGITGLQTTIPNIIVPAANADNEVAIGFITTYSSTDFRVREATNDGGLDPDDAADWNVVSNSRSFTVRLTAQPSAGQSITVGFATNNSRLQIAPANVTFTGANWNTPATFNVSATDDSIDNGFISANLVPTFTSVGNPPVNTESLSLPAYGVVDGDWAGLEFTTTSGGEVSEDGTRVVTFGVRLRTQPVGVVNVNATSLDAAEATTSPSVLSFNSSNWDVTQFVTIRGVEDSRRDGDKLFLVEVGNSSSTDAKYNPVRNFLWSGSAVQPLNNVASYQLLFRNIDSGRETPVVPPVVSTPPGVPGGLIATPGNREVSLVWAPNSAADGLIVYEVWYFALGKPEVLAGETSATNFTVKGLENGVTYVFRVRAKKIDGTVSAFSPSVQARPSIILGTENVKADQMLVYPNPSNGNFTIRLDGVNTARMNISVADVTGKVIFTQEFSNVSGSFQRDLVMREMPAGLYILTVTTDNDNYQAKLILENR